MHINQLNYIVGQFLICRNYNLFKNSKKKKKSQSKSPAVLGSIGSSEASKLVIP